MMQIRYKIKALADERNISIARLSRAANIDQANLFKLVNGKADDVKMSTLQSIARILEVPVVQLIEEYNDGFPESATS